jgi:small subunit ribosomal protein S16
VLKIRLQRTGRKNRPFYRIVVAEHSARIQGSYIEHIGHYDPLANPKVFQVNEAKIQEWISKGAKPTNTMARLMKGNGMQGMDPFIIRMVDRKKKKEAKAAAAAEGAAKPAEEAPQKPAS